MPGGYEYSPHAPAVKATPLKILQTYWTMHGEGTTARGILCAHPLGFEYRSITGADDLQRSQVHRTIEAADLDAAETRQRLIARGWTDIE